MKQESDRKNGKKLLELHAKALRRGEKLANTLRKLAANGAPSDALAQSFLTSLEQTLERMRQPESKAGSPKPVPRKVRAERISGDPGDKHSPSPKPRSRKGKPQPAPVAAV